MMWFADFIIEMAYRKQAGIEKIESQISPLTQHIVKCWVMPKSECVPHWKHEIRNIIDTMDTAANVKTKAGRITAKEMFKEYKWDTSEKTLGRRLELVSSEYSVEIPKKLQEQIIKKLQMFFGRLWVALEEDLVDYNKILKDLNI